MLRLYKQRSLEEARRFSALLIYLPVLLVYVDAGTCSQDRHSHDRSFRSETLVWCRISVGNQIEVATSRTNLSLYQTFKCWGFLFKVELNLFWIVLLFHSQIVQSPWLSEHFYLTAIGRLPAKEFSIWRGLCISWYAFISLLNATTAQD